MTVAKEDMVAAHEEGRKARKDNYAKNANPYLENQLRASWNRGWIAADNWIKSEHDQRNDDPHGDTWNLAEALSEIVRKEVAKQVQSAVQAWGMDQIERLPSERALDTCFDLVQDAHKRLSDCETTDVRLDERMDSLISTLHAAEIRLKEVGARVDSLETEDFANRMHALEEYSARGIQDNEERIEDIETTLERLEGLDGEKSYVTREDCLQWPDGFAAEYLSQVPEEVRQAAVDAAMKILDDNVEWVGPSPAAGPWKDGSPTDATSRVMYDALIQDSSGHVEVIRLHQDITTRVGPGFTILRHARINLPETEE